MYNLATGCELTVLLDPGRASALDTFALIYLNIYKKKP